VQADPQKWQEVTEQPQDALEWLIDEYAKRFDLSTVEGKRKTTTKALEIIAELLDPVEQEHYMNILAGRTDTSLQAVQAKLQNTMKLPTAPRLKPTKVTKVVQPNQYQYQDHLLAMSLFYPPLRDSLHKLQAENFEGGLRQTTFTLIQKLTTKPWQPEILERLQSDELRVKINELELIVEQKYDQLEDTLYFVASELSKRVLLSTKTKQKDKLAKELARTSGDERQALHAEYKKLVQEIEELKR
jgi:DNA primase